MVEPTVEYGFRDLGIIQEQRRLHLDAGFAGTTNDLALPLRLYHLRRIAATNSPLSPSLDAVAARIVGNRLPEARKQIEELEAAHGAGGGAESR